MYEDNLVFVKEMVSFKCLNLKVEKYELSYFEMDLKS